MEIKTYLVNNVNERSYYCPSCHNQLKLPFQGGNIICDGGINLNCSICKKGKIIIKTIKKNIINPDSGIINSGVIND